MEGRISHLEEEIKDCKRWRVVKVKIDDLQPNAHLLCVVHAVEKVIKQAAPHALLKLGFIGQPREESDNMAKHPDQLIEIVYDESFFEKN